MSWEAIGAVAEILGALAVFLSLIYLALQTRNNTRALRSAAFHQVRDSFADVSLTLAQDPVLASLVSRAMGGKNDLNEDEIYQFNFFLTSFLRRGESAYFQSMDGALQMESWLGIKETVTLALCTHYGRQWWDNNIENSSARFTEEYTEVLERALGERQST